jgi:hypothetical protein
MKIAAAVTLGICLGTGVSAAAAPVGQFQDVWGRVTVERGQRPATTGRLFLQLEREDVVRVGAGGRAEILLFQSGARFALGANSAVRVMPAQLRRLAGPEPRPLGQARQPFAGPRASSLPRRPVPQRLLGFVVRQGGEELLGPRHPQPHGAVRGGEPEAKPSVAVTLRWEGPIEGDSLRLQINDDERTLFRTVLPPTTREFSLPKGVLRPGRWYAWRVMAIQDGSSRQECSALLRLLLPEERATLERLEREAAQARAAEPVHPAPLLLLAQCYEGWGMFADARAAYHAVRRLRPDDAGVAAALQRLPAAK